MIVSFISFFTCREQITFMLPLNDISGVALSEAEAVANTKFQVNVREVHVIMQHQ